MTKQLEKPITELHTPPAHTFSDIQSLMSADILAMNDVLESNLHSGVDLIQTIGTHIINGGGKRIRPLLVLMCARALNADMNQAYKLAVIIEFIHTATLLHDDVIDHALVRRKLKAAHTIWGTEAAVLTGDFLYSRAMQMMTALNSIDLISIMSDATNLLTEGEVMQLMNAKQVQLTEAQYYEVIYAKTANLFEAAAHVSAVSTRQAHFIKPMKTFGRALGMAFQLIDDVLDYTGTTEAIGKQVGNDLKEGKPTLPLIYAMANGTEAQRDIIASALQAGDDSTLDQIVDIVQNTGAIAYTQEKAMAQANTATKALTALPENTYTQALFGLVDFAVNRQY